MGNKLRICIPEGICGQAEGDHCNATPAAHISLPSCKIKNSDVNECLKKYLQEVIKSSKKGNAEHSIPPMDPYFIPKIIIQPYRNDGVLVEMKNSSVYGFSNAIITKIQSDPRKGIFEIHYVTPTTKFSGSYTLTGKLFSIPINGKGLSNVTIHDFHHAVQVQGELRNSSDGNKYLDVKSVNVKLKPQKMRLNFEHLFKENKELDRPPAIRHYNVKITFIDKVT
ncbi:hypothetical protein PGB90_010368 [Kerria lacca]